MTEETSLINQVDRNALSTPSSPLLSSPEYQVMLAKIEESALEINNTTQLFQKTQSQFMDNLMTVSHFTPFRNIRQVLAEMKNARQALASGSYKATSGITPLTGVMNGYASGVLNVDPLKLMFVPSAITGSKTTYLCDYFYGHTSGQTGCLLAGGAWNYAGSAGPGCLNAVDAVSYVDSHIGARVEFLGATS